MQNDFKPPRRLPVNELDNSVCRSSPIHHLDWTNWWLDGSFGKMYLHVYRPSDDTWHRVYCREADCPRLMVVETQLHWLVDAMPG